MQVYYLHKARTGIQHLCGLMGLDHGGEVLAPAYNCGSEIDALVKGGAKVRFYEVRRSTEIRIEEVSSQITERTKAIYVIHYFGFPQPLDELKRICSGRGIYLIEDCALALFSSDGSTKFGTKGDASVFSFPKTLPVPDGGAMVINNADLVSEEWKLTRPSYIRVAKRMLPLVKSTVLRKVSRIVSSRYGNQRIEGREVDLQRTKDKVNDLVGSEMPGDYYFVEDVRNRELSSVTKCLLKMHEINRIIKSRRENFLKLLDLTTGVSGIEPLYKGLRTGVCPLCFPVIVANRDHLYTRLLEESIAAIPWWAGYHRQFSWDGFKEASFLKDHILALPIHQDLEPHEIDYIAKSLISSVQRM